VRAEILNFIIVCSFEEPTIYNPQQPVKSAELFFTSKRNMVVRCPMEGCNKTVKYGGLYCKTHQDDEIEYQVVNGTTFYKDKQTGDWCKLGQSLPGLQRVPHAYFAKDHPRMHATAMRNAAKCDTWVAEQIRKKCQKC
jgi:hypothetical protein